MTLHATTLTDSTKCGSSTQTPPPHLSTRFTLFVYLVGSQRTHSVRRTLSCQAFISPFMSPETREKIKFVDSCDTESVLLKELGPVTVRLYKDFDPSTFLARNYG